MHPTTLLKSIFAGCFAVSVAGCGGAAKPSAAAGTPTDLPKAPRGNAVFANELEGTNAAAPSRLRVVQLEIYQLVMPLGAVSRSEEFWKHVDEEGIDVGTYDLLRKNGWRLGIAPTNEWSYFRDIIDAYPANSKPFTLSTGNGGGGQLELEMKKGVPYQNIFYFTDQNALFGRTFEECDNIVTVALQQAPRKAGEARVTLCPTVRGLKRKFEVTSTEAGREIRLVHPERLYDLNMQVDVPIGHFLVIAPSPEVRWKTSLGATFLVQDAAAEQLEQVLLLIPRTAELEETGRTPAP